MAVTARFQADFANFYDAVQKAESKLSDFTTGAGKVEGALNRMVDGFSGRKLIQDATLMAEAVERVGGVSKLTEDELARVSAKASEAASKLRALGEDVPAGIQRIANETKNATTATSELSSTVRGLASDFLAMFTIRAAFDFVKSMVNSASALNDLSQQTHISVEDIQTLSGAMSQFGVDSDTLARGLFKLSRGIAGGDESVANGLHLMGMSLKDVQGLNGEELFLAIEHGLSTLQGGLRDTAAAEIFGGKLGGAMARSAEGIDTALEEWKRLNTVASTESVEAQDKFGESIERTVAHMKALATNMAGPVAQGFNVLFEASNKGASTWGLVSAMYTDWVEKNLKLGTGTAHLTALLAEQNQAVDLASVRAAAIAALHGDVAVAVDKRSQAEKFLAAVEADANVTVTAAQIASLERLKELGALNAKNAEGVGVSAAQYAKYTQQVKEAAEAQKTLGELLKQVQQIEADSRAKSEQGVLGLGKLQQEESQKHFEAEARGIEEITKAGAALRDFQMKNALDTASFQIVKIWEAADAQVAAFKGTSDQVAAFTTKVMALAAEEANAVVYAADKALDEVAAKAGTIARAVQLAIQQVGSGQAVDVVANRAGVTGVGMQAPIYVSPPIFARASGGSVTSGQPYMVGERGPELFTPSSSGFITPNGGGATVTNHIYVNGTAEEAAQKIAKLVMRTVLDGTKMSA